MLLTPNHFLISQIGCQYTGFDLETNYRYNPKKHWRRIQELISHFWYGWTHEWVPSQSSRKKWYNSQKNLQVRDIVLLITVKILQLIGYRITYHNKSYCYHNNYVIAIFAQAFKLIQFQWTKFHNWSDKPYFAWVTSDTFLKASEVIEIMV